MSYKHRASQIIADAQQRVTNLKVISPTLDLGNGLTVMAFNAQVALTQTSLDNYNTLLTKADAAGNDFNTVEKNLGTLSSRMLAAVGVKYGKDSNEYEMAGGTRTSEIDRSHKPEEPGT